MATVEKAINIFGAIVTVALVATLVSPKSQTAKVVDSVGRLFTGGLREARRGT